jgi:hypothetical protein
MRFDKCECAGSPMDALKIGRPLSCSLGWCSKNAKLIEKAAAELSFSWRLVKCMLH